MGKIWGCQKIFCQKDPPPPKRVGRDYPRNTRLNQQLDITGLPSSFYMTPSELFIRNNKNMECFEQNFTQKYANRDIIASITSRLNQLHGITYLTIYFIWI